MARRDAELLLTWQYHPPGCLALLRRCSGRIPLNGQAMHVNATIHGNADHYNRRTLQL